MKCSNDKCPTYLKEEKNLLENIDNQDKILEEKLSEKKKAKEKLKKKGISFNWDYDVTKDTGNVNEK